MLQTAKYLFSRGDHVGKSEGWGRGLREKVTATAAAAAAAAAGAATGQMSRVLNHLSALRQGFFSQT